MKKTAAIFLSAVMALSVWACGPKPDPSKEIIGTWEWNIGSTEWTFIFTENGECIHYSGNGAYNKKTTTYRILDNKHIEIADLAGSWDLYYTDDKNEFRLWHVYGNSTPEFKRISYSPIGINNSSKETDVMLPVEKISTILEAGTVRALNNEVISKKNSKPAWSSEIDAGMCSYNISQMKTEGKNYVVYGTLYLKDAYNHSTAKYKDGSGGSSVDFQAKFDSDCHLVSINLK